MLLPLRGCGGCTNRTTAVVSVVDGRRTVSISVKSLLHIEG